MPVDAIIRILIVDDHPMMREGLRSVLEDERDMKVVGEAADGVEGVQAFHESRPDVVLMDLQMPRMDGIQAIQEIHEAAPDTPIVVLTTYPGDARVSRAMTLGAMSYLLKTASRPDIVSAVRSAMLGRRHVAAELSQDVSEHQGMEPLNPRELSVLRLAAQGKSNREIGDVLHVAEDTIKTRMKTILSKLNANDRTHAVTIAIRRGFIDS